MVSVFTTFRRFDRPQRNAVKSWLACGKFVEVIIFTNDDFDKELQNDSRVKVVKSFRSHPTGLPLLNDLFAQSSHISKYETICYCNADIILLPGFVDYLEPLFNLRKSYLGVSQRTDVDVDFEIDFGDDASINGLKAAIEKSGSIHPPLGSDIFVFPKQQYKEGNMPDLVVGRPGWDLWMIYNARDRFNRLVNLNCSDLVVHQNHEAKYNPQKEGDQMNYQFLPKTDLFTFVLSYCNFKLEGGRIKLQVSQETGIRRVRWETKFNNRNILSIYFGALLIVRKIEKKINKKLGRIKRS